MAFVKRTPTEAVRPGIAPDELPRELAHAEPARRWAAARELQRHSGNGALLAARLAVEPDPGVREVLVTALVTVRDPGCLPGLFELLRSPDTGLRNNALDALEQLPTLVGPHLGDLLGSPEPQLRIFAVGLVGNQPGPAATGLLTALIGREEHVNVCACALEKLGEMGGPEVLEVLAAYRPRLATEDYLRFCLDEAARRIGSR